MRWLNGRILLLALLPVSLFLQLFITPFIANAASPYDSTVVLTRNLVIKYAGQSDVDVSTDYLSRMEVATQPSGSTLPVCDTSCRNTINASLDHGDWAIYATNTSYTGSAQTLATAFFCDKKMTATFQTISGNNYLVANPTDGTGTMNCTQGTIQYQNITAGWTVVGGASYSGAVGGFVIGNGTNDYQLFLYTGAITYPSGYSGATPPSSYTPPNNIQFVWGVDQNGVVTATYTQNLPQQQEDMLTHCGITWELTNSDSSWNPGTVVDTKTQEKTLTYRYDHITPGFYQLKSKPNWCTPYIDDGSISSTTVNIPFNGSFVGGTSSAGGNTAGPFATQSTILNQFGLTQAVQAPLNAIRRLVGTTCNPVVLPSFGGGAITLPCMSGYYSTLSVMYGIWQVTITGVVAYWFSIKAFHHIRGLLNPNNDAIATVDL